MADKDDMPEMEPSKADGRRTLSNARARALQQFKKRTVWDAVDEEMLEVVVDLKMLREFGDEDGRKFALREMAALWRGMPPRPVAPPAKGMTAEEYQAALDAASKDAAVQRHMAAHPDMQAALVAMGWKPPAGVVPSKEKN